MPNDTTTQADKDRLYWEHVDKLKSLDPDTWDYLICGLRNRLRRDIERSLARYGLPTDLVDDMEQQTWVTAVEEIESFHWIDEERFYRWLRVISCNFIYEIRRDRNRTVSIEDFENNPDDIDFDSFLERYNLRDDGIEHRVELRHRMIAIERALQVLKPQEREIFVRWLMGERPRVLAVIYGKRNNSLRRLLQRAKQKVLFHLGESPAGFVLGENSDG
jgi:RNA polymerase sigma factor (sigma-70 family)